MIKKRLYIDICENMNIIRIGYDFCKKGVKAMRVAIRHNKIKKILARKNMSQNCFAMRLGKSSGYMSQLMSGVRNPSPVLRKKILAELKMDENGFDEIFELKG